MSVKLLTVVNIILSFEFLSLKGGCTGSSESTLVKMPHCWNSRVTAQLCAATREKFPTRYVSDQPAQLQRLVRTFHCCMEQDCLLFFPDVE